VWLKLQICVNEDGSVNDPAMQSNGTIDMLTACAVASKPVKVVDKSVCLKADGSLSDGSSTEYIAVEMVPECDSLSNKSTKQVGVDIDWND
jgi:hypothetical protein